MRIFKKKKGGEGRENTTNRKMHLILKITVQTVQNGNRRMIDWERLLREAILLVSQRQYVNLSAVSLMLGIRNDYYIQSCFHLHLILHLTSTPNCNSQQQQQQQTLPLPLSFSLSTERIVVEIPIKNKKIIHLQHPLQHLLFLFLFLFLFFSFNK